jgi:hypothetical protein
MTHYGQQLSINHRSRASAHRDAPQSLRSTRVSRVDLCNMAGTRTGCARRVHFDPHCRRTRATRISARAPPHAAPTACVDAPQRGRHNAPTGGARSEGRLGTTLRAPNRERAVGAEAL